MSYCKSYQNGVILYVYVQPGAKTQGLVGLHGERLKVRIQAPATDNKANEQIVNFLGKLLGLPGSSIEIIRGQKSRNKDIYAPLSEVEAKLKLETALK